MADRGQTPPSWAIAARLEAESHAGIRVQSFAPGTQETDVNAVFWRWAQHPPHQVRIIDDHHRLLRDDSSWASQGR
jgi:hypothetical protein